MKKTVKIPRERFQLNRYQKGHYILSGDYLDYRTDGGKLNPSAWNQRIKELRKEQRKGELK